MELDTNDVLKNLQLSLSMVEQISEKDKKKIDLIMDESKIIKNSNLHIDPCILTRIDQIDIELAKLRSMRQQEDSKRDTLNKMAKRYHDQISEIDNNYETIMDIQDKLTKSFDECDKMKRFDTFNEETSNEETDGGAGFLGQHLIREIQEKSDDIQEIRVLDLIKYENNLNNHRRVPVINLTCDVSLMTTEFKNAFKNVSTVFHCAAYVNYDFPPDKDKLDRNNVLGTKNVIEACLENGVRSLIYTSTTEVCIKPYFNNGFFCIIINQTETRELPPKNDRQLVFGYYAASKLKGEEMVLASDNEMHYYGGTRLRTISLRPSFMYGEEDNGIFKLLIHQKNNLRRIGLGGKHQFVYAGNVAWAHLRAKKVLECNPNAVGGLPVFVTDDTNLFDIFKFCEILTETKIQKKSIPCILLFFIFFIFEILYQFIFKFNLKRLQFSPKNLVVYLGSAIFFSRLRAVLHLNYSPIYDQIESIKRSREYYLCTNNNYK